MFRSAIDDACGYRNRFVSTFRVGCCALLLLISNSVASAADWPMWRFDARRSAHTPEQLAGQLDLQWSIQQAAPHVAWPEDPRLQFDASYQPIVLDNSIFVSSSRNDSVTAYNTISGALRWRFYADGPVRFAPVAWKEKIYFGADDGIFYCLDAANGSVIWKFRAAPAARMAIGNERLISVWPMRGGPVLAFKYLETIGAHHASKAEQHIVGGDRLTVPPPGGRDQVEGIS